MIDLEKKITMLWSNPKIVKELGMKAFQKLQQEYSSEVVYKKWLKLMNGLLCSK